MEKKMKLAPINPDRYGVGVDMRIFSNPDQTHHNPILCSIEHNPTPKIKNKYFFVSKNRVNNTLYME